MSFHFLLSLLHCFTYSDVSVFAFRLKRPGHSTAKGPSATDIRGNNIQSTIDETLWSVRVINAAGHERVQCVMPDGSSMPLEERDSVLRATPDAPLNKFSRGRMSVDDSPEHSSRKKRIVERMGSAENHHAGITMLEFMPEEAKRFFDEPVKHDGKNKNVRTEHQSNMSAHFLKIGAPFIAGPSGSIEALILSMEDNCVGACKDGLIPYQNHLMREALIGLMTAALVAGGHHSITECLLISQAMGYFKAIPDVLRDYKVGVEAFESYLTRLGVAPGVLQSSSEQGGDEDDVRPQKSKEKE